MVVSREDAVATVKDLLENFDWDTSYGGSPQIIASRNKGLDRTVSNQSPTLGWIFISEVNRTPVRGDALYNSQDVSYMISFKISSNLRTRTNQIWAGLTACAWTNRRRPDPNTGTTFDIWEPVRQSSLQEFADMYTIIEEHELRLFKETLTP